MKASKKVAALAGVVAGAFAIGAIAFAAWTSSGIGSGSAGSTTAKTSAITAEVADANLYPGATQSVTVRVTNPNDYPVMVTGIEAGSSKAVGACAADTVRSDARSDLKGIVQTDGKSATIAANDSGVYSLVTRMSNDASDACKSQTFSLPLTASLESVATGQDF